MTNKITTPVIINDPEYALSTIRNEDLKKAIQGILESSNGLNVNMWQLAVNAHNISENELYKEDYESLNNFCKAIDIPKSKFSKYVNAVKVMVNRLTPDYGITMEELVYTKAYLMSTIPDDMLDGFMALHTPAEIVKIAYSQLEALIKKYLKPTQEAVETEAKETETEQEDPNTVTGIIYQDKQGKGKKAVITFGIAFEWQGKIYQVPFDPDKYVDQVDESETVKA